MRKLSRPAKLKLQHGGWKKLVNVFSIYIDLHQYAIIPQVQRINRKQTANHSRFVTLWQFARAVPERFGRTKIWLYSLAFLYNPNLLCICRGTWVALIQKSHQICGRRQRKLLNLEKAFQSHHKPDLVGKATSFRSS